MKKNKIFYGWINVAACIALMLVILGLGNATISLYVKPISDDLSLSRASVASIVSIMALTVAAFSMLYGSITKKLSMKLLIVIGAVAASIGFGLFSISNSLIVFYVFAVIIGFGISFTTTIPISAVIQNWFIEKRGLILGIVFSASGVGGMIFNPLISKFITNYGWRTTFQIEAVIMLAIALPGALLISIDPKEKGTVALGSEKNNSNEKGKNKEVTGLTLKEAKGTVSFKLVVISVISFAIGLQPLLYIVPAYFSDAGFDPSVGATIMALIFIVNAFSKIFLGMVSDKFGLKTVLIIGCSSFIISDIILLLTTTTSMGYIFAFFYGIALTMMTIPLPLIVSTLYVQKDYSSILGILMGILTIGMAVGIPLWNISYDKLGSYIPAYIGGIVLVIIALATSLIALRLKPELNKTN